MSKNIKEMTLGEACAVFRKIKDDKYSVEEKVLAIYIVSNMETHNSITKKEMLEVIDWLLHTDFEALDEHEYRMDGLMFM